MTLSPRFPILGGLAIAGGPLPEKPETIRVTGGVPLQGEIAVLGAKNAALKHMVAALLAPGVHQIDNVPSIADVAIMERVLEHVGAQCRRDGQTLLITVPERPTPEAPLDLVRQMRASILILGALLARTGEARVALPGGDDFGSRPIDMHLEGLERMGAEFELVHGVLVARAPDGLRGTDLFLEFPSVGATENLLLAAVLAHGRTTIGNAAREPELADMAEYLRKMGAKIEGAGTSTIEVHGVSNLSPAHHRVVPDRLEAGTYAAAAAMSGGVVTVRDSVPGHLRMELAKLEAAGCGIEDGADWFTIRGPDRPTPVDFATLPYPGFHTDMHPQMVALLSVGDGTSIMTENVYSARFRYIGELNRLGADIHADGHHVVIRGVETLSGCEVDGCDIRAAAALVIAGLRADGETVVTNAQHLDRGYAGFIPKLAALGAQIERL
jgi:UDP-N-acetylglucosamine 1-carboxyvinyltransferase